MNVAVSFALALALNFLGYFFSSPPLSAFQRRPERLDRIGIHADLILAQDQFPKTISRLTLARCPCGASPSGACPREDVPFDN